MFDLLQVSSNVWFAVTMIGFLIVGVYALDTWRMLKDEEPEEEEQT